MKDLYKITFLGDFMCEGALLQAAQSESFYDFKRAFDGLKSMLVNSDLVIGNFEAVLTGNGKYTAQQNIFSTPDSFAVAIREAGVDVLTTANNHAFDGGVEGVQRTVEVLQKLGFKTVGTMPELNNRHLLLDTKIGKISILAYTESVNGLRSNDFPIDKHINLLCPLPTDKEVEEIKLRIYKGFGGKIKYIISKFFNLKSMKKIKAIIYEFLSRKQKISVPSYTDTLSARHQDKRYLSMIEDDILNAKKQSDFVFACCHCGGQFNAQQGTYVDYIQKIFKGCCITAFIGNHPHVAQRINLYSDGYLEASSLGSVIQTVDGVRLGDPSMPQYSIALHYYISKQNKKVENITLSLLRIGVDETRYQYVLSLKDYLSMGCITADELKKDVTTLLKRISPSFDNNEVRIQNEYKIPVISE